MRTNILATAIALSDRDLLARLDALALTDRGTTAEIVGHLTALERRPSLYLAQGYGSLYDYCTRALRFSEDAACSRIGAVRACTRFPLLLDHLASGAMTLTSVRLVGPHLTPENHEAVLARAKDKGRKEIEALVAELAPRPDVPGSVRKLPERKGVCMEPVGSAGTLASFPLWTVATPTDRPAGTGEAAARIDVSRNLASPASTIDPPPVLRPPDPRPIVQVLAPHRYRVQLTIGQEAHDDLRTVQTLLRREIPNGDPGAIFERALALLRREVEKAKLGIVANPRRRVREVRARGRVYEKRIRFRTDKCETQVSSPGTPASASSQTPGDASCEVKTAIRTERAPSRHIPNEVKRVVWYRDRGQCAFVSATGRRCAERNFLELHHIQPYAMEGQATAGNIALRCGTTNTRRS